ncbi:hypothetical protein [Streptomyces triculaminicus]|uniref:hypothetical protein n=1 Tax=Streptomyces triculaminicus TaxID=2816232 RepID=UPI0037D5E3E4
MPPAPGRVIGVTRTALNRLSDGELAALLHANRAAAGHAPLSAGTGTRCPDVPSGGSPT